MQIPITSVSQATMLVVPKAGQSNKMRHESDFLDSHLKFDAG